MNGYERVLATLDRQPLDTLAFMPITMMFATDRIDATYGRYVSDYNDVTQS